MANTHLHTAARRIAALLLGLVVLIVPVVFLGGAQIVQPTPQQHVDAQRQVMREIEDAKLRERVAKVEQYNSELQEAHLRDRMARVEGSFDLVLKVLLAILGVITGTAAYMVRGMSRLKRVGNQVSEFLDHSAQGVSVRLVNVEKLLEGLPCQREADDSTCGD